MEVLGKHEGGSRASVCVTGTSSSHISGGHGDEAHSSRGVLHMEPSP